jgi:hypothetical protein
MAKDRIQIILGKIKSVKNSVKDSLSKEGRKEIATNYGSVVKGWANKKEMFGNLVNKEVNKQYPTGLANNSSNLEIRKKIAKELKKSKPILKDISY